MNAGSDWSSSSALLTLKPIHFNKSEQLRSKVEESLSARIGRVLRVYE